MATTPAWLRLHENHAHLPYRHAALVTALVTLTEGVMQFVLFHVSFGTLEMYSLWKVIYSEWVSSPTSHQSRLHGSTRPFQRTCLMHSCLEETMHSFMRRVHLCTFSCKVWCAFKLEEDPDVRRIYRRGFGAPAMRTSQHAPQTCDEAPSCHRTLALTPQSDHDYVMSRC